MRNFVSVDPFIDFKNAKQAVVERKFESLAMMRVFNPALSMLSIIAVNMLLQFSKAFDAPMLQYDLDFSLEKNSNTYSKSLAKALLQNKTLLLYGLPALLLTGWAVNACCSNRDPRVDDLVVTDGKGKEAIGAYRSETKKMYGGEVKGVYLPSEAPNHELVTWVVVGAIALSYLLYGASRSIEDHPSKYMMSILSVFSWLAVGVTHRLAGRLLASDTDKKAERAAQQLKVMTKKQGLNLNISVEKVAAGEVSEHYLRVGFSDRHFSGIARKGMMDYVCSRKARYNDFIQQSKNQLLISPTKVNMAKLQVRLNRHWKVLSASRAMSDALREINSKIYRNRDFKCTNTASDASFGVTVCRVWRIRPPAVMDVEKLKIVFPEAEIAVNPTDASEVEIKRLSKINSVGLSEWVEEVQALYQEEVRQRRLSASASSCYSPESNIEANQVYTVRRMRTAASIRRELAYTGGGELDPGVAPTSQREHKYPQQFIYHHTNGGDYTAYKIDFVSDKKRVAYMACALTVKQFKNSRQLDAIQFAIGGVLRCGRHNNVKSYTSKINDRTNPTDPRSVDGSFELRVMSGKWRGLRGLATCVGPKLIPGDADARMAPVHLLVDVPQSLTKHHGKRG
ncbi:MAG: hypothetical protein P1U63_07075 [Coxiellaceae bacterium]|nr:hypothetical protein [Coxiellaceae bacterium]